MTERRLQCNRRSLIANIDWLITVDPGRRIIRDAAIAVTAARSSPSASRPRSPRTIPARASVDGRHTVATPGFVDCHLHSSFQLSRGLADEANAQSFLFDRMYPYEAALEGEDVRVSATLAAAELLKHGVTCFIDPGNYHPEASVEGVMSTGIRCIVSRSSFDLTKSVLGILPERMIEITARGARARRGGAGEIRQDPAIRGSAPAPRSAASTMRPTN